jgi:hypothetical protein
VDGVGTKLKLAFYPDGEYDHFLGYLGIQLAGG